MRTALFFAALLVGLAACEPAPTTPAAGADATNSATVDPATAGSSTPAPSAGAAPKVRTELNDASTVAEIHAALIDPGSQALFLAESTLPADEAEWNALADAAQQIIEGAKLMKTASRAQGRPEWIAAADAVIASTRETADLVAARKGDDLVFANGEMMNGCTSCHQQFRNMAAAPTP